MRAVRNARSDRRRYLLRVHMLKRKRIKCLEKPAKKRSGFDCLPLAARATCIRPSERYCGTLPSEAPLELVPRVRGYICRGRVRLDDLEEPPASDATAVAFFRLMATAVQTLRLAARAAEPTGCCQGAAMVVWSPLSDISFTELAAAEGHRRGLCAHLQALRATGLLRALERCMVKCYDALPLGRSAKGKRRRLNEDLEELRKAIEHVDAPGGNALGQSAPPMRRWRAPWST